MNDWEIYDAAFTEGYAHAIDSRAKRQGVPMEMVLIGADAVILWRNSYELGFANGKADSHSLQQWRENLRSAERSEEGLQDEIGRDVQR